jgi:hypothetical protein
MGRDRFRSQASNGIAGSQSYCAMVVDQTKFAMLDIRKIFDAGSIRR